MHAALGVERKRELVGNDAGVAGSGLWSTGILVLVANCALRILRIALARRAEGEFVVVGKRQALAAHQRRNTHRQARGRTARHVVHLHVHGHFARIDQGLLLLRTGTAR